MEFSLEMSPQDVVALQKEGGKVVVIDVREPWEFAVSKIDGCRLIPMQAIPDELASLRSVATDNALAILCHHGVRSLNVATWLRRQGIDACFSVSGGIDRWSREIDGSVPRY